MKNTSKFDEEFSYLAEGSTSSFFTLDDNMDGGSWFMLFIFLSPRLLDNTGFSNCVVRFTWLENDEDEYVSIKQIKTLPFCLRYWRSHSRKIFMRKKLIFVPAINSSFYHN